MTAYLAGLALRGIAALALLGSLPAAAQTYRDTGGTAVPGVVVVNPTDNSGPLFSNANPGHVAAVPPTNVAPNDCSLSITTGGAAQNLFTAQTTVHGFTAGNIDPLTGSGEPICISFTGTAAYTGTGATLACAAGSWPLPAPAATSLAGMGSYTTPSGFGINHAVSVIAPTTGHRISCAWW